MRITVNIPEKVKGERKHRSAVDAVIRKVRRGEKAYRSGKTRVIRSIRELM